ncbi:MAG: hypothetical protein SFU85_04630 [Candidatus Methylacidiphilales bacterium]|nr:hypothetical protein [Candidatus Methylacidiphilales bacterium]
MIPQLPLAADIGELIIPAIILVVGFIQWLMGLLNKSKKPAEPAPDPFGGPRQRPATEPDEPAEVNWDDLMDALGRAPNQPLPEAPAQPAAPVPPPLRPPVIPAAQEEVRAPLSTPFRNMEPTPEPADGLSDHLKTLLAAMDRPRTSLSPIEHANMESLQQSAPATEVTGRTSTRFARFLREPGQLRRAIVLQEILQPPLALR